MWGYRLDGAGSVYGHVAGISTFGSIKCGEFLDSLKTGKLLKKGSAPWSKEVGTMQLCKEENDRNH